jgi:hypothetical protein
MLLILTLRFVVLSKTKIRVGCVKRLTHSQSNWAISFVTSYLMEKLSNAAEVWQAIAQASELSFPIVFHTANCAVHSGNPTVFSVYLRTPRWHRLKAHPFLTIHSAHEYRMINSFSYTTSYYTFYALFSSFRVTLCPMWLANSKRQQCFVYHIHTHKKTHRTEKNWKTWWEICDVPANIQFSFSCSFLHS